MRPGWKIALLALAGIGAAGFAIHEWARKKAGRVIAVDGDWYEVETEDDPRKFCAEEGTSAIELFNNLLGRYR